MLEYFTSKIKKLVMLTTINSSEHKLKIPRTQLMTKASPERKSGIQWKARVINKRQKKG
jgi:hypothetical protein